MNTAYALPYLFSEPNKHTEAPKLPLTKYRFTFKAQQDIPSFTLSGSVWHGLWGKALHQRSCTIPNTRCQHCLLLHQCHYSFLFRGTRPPQAKRMRHYTHIPVPHTFQQTEQHLQHMQEGDLFSVEFVFIGDPQPYLLLILQTMMAIGQAGFGKKRYQATLYQVIQRANSDTNSNDDQVILSQGHYSPPIPSLPVVYPACPDQIRLQFLSPCQLSTKKPHAYQFSLSYFLMSIIRRISHLQYFYTDHALETDFPQLKRDTEQAEQQIIKQHLKREKKQRYSAKHQCHISITGFIGYVDISLKQLKTLWPYLYLGQQLNTGKNASMGYGQYEMIILPQST